MSIRFRFSVLGLLIWLISYSVNGQEVKDGFIILANGDYKYGTIQFQPTLNVYEECLFYSETKKEYIKYTPETILGYGVINGIHFITKEIAAGEAQQKHFLKKEIDGLVKLYSYSNNRFFVEKDGFKEIKANDYKALLTEALSACKSISFSVRKTSFNLADLKALFLKYQRCTNTETTKESFDRFQFDALAGVELNTTTLSGVKSMMTKDKLSLKDKTLLGAGFNVNISVKKNKHFSWVTGAHYYQQNFYTITHSSTPAYSSTDRINLDYREVLIPIALNYTLIKKERPIMPYLKAGIFIPITIKSSLTWENQKEYTSTVFFEQYNLPQKFKHAIPLSLSAGATFILIGNFRNLFEVSYIKDGGELKNSSNKLTTDSSRIIVLLGFRF